MLRGSVFTDRGVYREMEEVHVKAVVRDDTPSGMRLVPAGRALDVVVFDAAAEGSRSADGHRERVEQRRVDVARAGRLSRLGHYSIVLSRAGDDAVHEDGVTSPARFSWPRSVGPTSASMRR